jgi:hypothetical protein
MGIRGAVRDFLELLGVPMEAVTTGVITTQRLLIPEPVMCGSAPALQLQLFRRQLFRVTSQGGGGGGLRGEGRAGAAQRCDECPVCHVLLLQRGEEYSRQIENFEALRAMVVKEAAAYGCSLGVQQGGGSLREQLQSFANASVIVAAHGAGLSNILVMPPGGLVVELMPMLPHVNLCYMDLAIKLRIRHTAVLHANAHMMNPAFKADLPRVIEPQTLNPKP